MHRSFPLSLKLRRMYNLATSRGVLNFEITNRCQMRCKHCYFFRTDVKEKELDLKDIIKIAKDFRKSGGKHAWITGGEPTCRMDAVEAVIDIIPNVRIVTNGFKQIPLKHDVLIFYSLEGGREDNLRVRGRDSWNSLYQNYQDDKRVITVMTTNSSNYKSMAEFVKLSRKANIRGCVFSIYTSSKLSKDDPMKLSSVQKKAVLEIFKKLKKENGMFIKMGTPCMQVLLDGIGYDRCVWKKSRVLRFNGKYKFCPMFETSEEADCDNCGCVSAGVKTEKLSVIPYVLDLI